jgi:hypothetical protein
MEHGEEHLKGMIDLIITRKGDNKARFDSRIMLRRILGIYRNLSRGEAGSLLKILIMGQRGIVIIARHGGVGSSPKKRILHHCSREDTYPIQGII